MNVEMRSLSDIRPYEKNPRHNDDAVQAVAASIREFGFQQPIVVDHAGVIIAGHTRYKAAKKLGLSKVPVVVADGLSDEQVRAYRLADNKTGELSFWDDDLLSQELQGILSLDMSVFGFLGDDGDNDAESAYSTKVNIPQYEITGAMPRLDELVDTGKADALIAEIESADGITDEEKQFLIQASRRHNVFNYRNIAEYYAHATPEMQRLMEKNALVIIDVDNAIANGYAKLSDDIMAMMEDADDA